MAKKPIKSAKESNVPQVDSVQASGDSQPLLCEVSWEVCQQLGGIYTVMRSKAPAMVERWQDRYCLIGPYNPAVSPAEFEEEAPTGHFGAAINILKERGIEVHFGTWLITGRPRVLLLNTRKAMSRTAEIKYILWEKDGMALNENDSLIDQVVVFGSLVEEFLDALGKTEGLKRPIVAQFHEWMAASCIASVRRRKIPVSIVFTTHATQLGRFLAMANPYYFDTIPHVKWHAEARRFNIEGKVCIERAAAHHAHVMTTVSEITGYECEHLLGRKPDVLLPNGLNIERFTALHEFQNLHRTFKERIQQFVIGHFFPSYSFDLDKTLFFFISGRYEYNNKGFDLSIESMARLNWKMKQARSPMSVVFFLITKADYRNINPAVLQTRAVMEEIRRDCESIQRQIGERLFVSVASGKWPKMDDLVDDYWRLRLRRTLYAWKTERLPGIVTHDMADDANDAILKQLRACQLINRKEDPVKVVFHPDFLTSSNPLINLDYDQFVRGCHLGIFPSTYEPWGYAPLECLALGIPAVTSDLSGFGRYVMRHIQGHTEKGMMVLPRHNTSYDSSANQLTEWLFRFVQLERRERISLRNTAESVSEQFDWKFLGRYYNEAHDLALKKSGH